MEIVIARYLIRRTVRRAGASIWQALEDHVWLPLLIAVILLLIVNFPT